MLEFCGVRKRDNKHVAPKSPRRSTQFRAIPPLVDPLSALGPLPLLFLCFLFKSLSSPSCPPNGTAKSKPTWTALFHFYSNCPNVSSAHAYPQVFKSLLVCFPNLALFRSINSSCHRCLRLSIQSLSASLVLNTTKSGPIKVPASFAIVLPFKPSSTMATIKPTRLSFWPTMHIPIRTGVDGPRR
jgi:hypothetical protein